jgi:hypothetical protein
MTASSHVCRLLRYGLLPCVAILWAHCSWDAPHDNPRDPYLGGNITGAVLTRQATGIPQASIDLPEADRATRTDSTGTFALYDLPEGRLWLHVSADCYRPDSAFLDLKKGKIDSLTLRLDGLPYFTSCRMTAHVYGRSWPPEPIRFCQFAAFAGDQDGESDLDSVWVAIPGLAYTQRLTYDPDQRIFTQTLWAFSLPNQSIETLVGLPVQFGVVDKESASVLAAPGNSFRIIRDLPEPEFPRGGLDSLTGDTTFIWHTFNYGYWVRYHNEIVRIEGGGPAGVAATFEGDAPADTTYQFPVSSLESGDYYWTLEAIDAFGNSSRSAEQRFHVH